MNNQILSVQNNDIVQIGPHRNTFNDGVSVFVKIIKSNDNGTYVGSVSGNRVTISSSRELSVGTSFVATITAKNGTIFITPKSEKINKASVPIEMSIVQGAKLGQILSDLGVPANLLSENLLKMMMQLELKIDGEILRKIYSLSLKHKGKEKTAGEILLLLIKKSINVSSDEINKIIDFLEEDFVFSDSGHFKQKDRKNKFEDKIAKKLINDINSKKGGWFFIPFNIIEVDSENIIGAGIIRFLVSNSDILKMINFNCYFDNKEFLFSLSFENKKCNIIRFYITPCERNKSYYENQLKELFNYDDISIKWCDRNLIEGCGSEGEVIHSIDGEI